MCCLAFITYSSLHPAKTPSWQLLLLLVTLLLVRLLVTLLLVTLCDPQVPVDAPERFLVEILFSNGANYNPTEVFPRDRDHTLPVKPRACLVEGRGVPLAHAVELLGPVAGGIKVVPSNYELQVRWLTARGLSGN